MAVVIFCLATAISVKADGDGNVRLGYIYTDETGNLGVNRETFNLYDGMAVSFEDFHYLTGDGLNFSADLKNITLNNRNLKTSLSKAGLFGFTLSNTQYRRNYDFDGNRFTRRRSSGAQLYIHALRNIKVSGGYSRIDRHGQGQTIYSPIADTVQYSTDYSIASYNIGLEAFSSAGNIRFSYRRFDYNDEAHSDRDRGADVFDISGFAPLPQYRRIVISAGYHYRLDNHKSSMLDLKTHQGWGATRVYLPHNMSFEYRSLIARTKHEGNLIETDNFVNTASISKLFPNWGGLRLGYENRISDDLIDRSESNSFLMAGWFQHKNRLYLRLRFTSREKEVTTGATLVGEEEFVRYQLSARYKSDRCGELMLRYQRKTKTNEDIGTRADYKVITTGYDLKIEKLGRVNITYSYYLGEFENRGQAVPSKFEFADHLIVGRFTSETYRNLNVFAGGSYYRSQRDLDVEKFGLDFGMQYLFPKDHQLEVIYRVYNYDDFLVRDKYYTGNIVEISLTKKIKF